MSETLRVLLVEDNPADVEMIEAILPASGPVHFQIETVSRLADACARLACEGIDLLLADLGLPDSQGLETLRKLREAAPQIPVVVLTGNDDQESALTAVKEGAQDYLVKGRIDGELLVRSARYAVERKRTEERLQKSNRDLETALQQLRKTQTQMIHRERLSALGQMASGIAHDFNNVLMPIVAFSDMLISEPEMLNNRDETMSCLKEIKGAAEDARQIVQHLRLIQGSGDNSQRAPVDMNEIVRNAVEMTRPRWDTEMAGKNVCIQIKTSLKAGRRVMGKPAELREAMMNLIMNAADAVPEGGTVTISSAVERNEVVVVVSDAGTGMTDETKERCLEPFFTTKGVKGAGLGLPMVLGIVIRHNGTLKIDSKPGRGTTVQIRLPCAPVEPVAKHVDDVKLDSAIAPLRILVADDEARSRNLIERLLKKDGHTIETAQTGREAIDKANANTFDLVITDRAMPEVNGDFVARAVKARTPEVPVILLTGFGDVMKDEGARPEGVDMIMSKPITRSELQRAVADTMAARHRPQTGQMKKMRKMKRLLVIDDDARVSQTVKFFFERQKDYEVISALDGKAGIRAAQRKNPDLILLDINMPEMTGLEVLKHLNNQKGICCIPVIMLTGVDTKEARVEANHNYAEYYAAKPVDLPLLQTKIERILSLRPTGAERPR